MGEAQPRGCAMGLEMNIVEARETALLLDVDLDDLALLLLDLDFHALLELVYPIIEFDLLAVHIMNVDVPLQFDGSLLLAFLDDKFERVLVIADDDRLSRENPARED